MWRPSGLFLGAFGHESRTAVATWTRRRRQRQPGGGHQLDAEQFNGAVQRRNRFFMKSTAKPNSKARRA